VWPQEYRTIEHDGVEYPWTVWKCTLPGTTCSVPPDWFAGLAGGYEDSSVNRDYRTMPDALSDIVAAFAKLPAARRAELLSTLTPVEVGT
jgi:hypothetical protein